MGQTADELTRGAGRSLAADSDVEYVGTYETTNVYVEEDADTEEIRVEIEQTRAELGETLDAIQERLNPHVLMDQAKEQIAETKDHLVDQAKDAVREATIGRAEHMVQNASDTARETGFSLLETISRNPIPAALVGIGLAWMFMGGKESSSSRYSYRSRAAYPNMGMGYRGGDGPWIDSGVGPAGTTARRMAGQSYGGAGQSYSGAGQSQGVVGQVAERAQDVVGSAADTAQSAVGQAADTVQSAAGGLADTAQYAVGGFADQVESAPGQLERLVRENPLGMGAIALGIGAAVGLAMPSTPVESQVMGQARDKVMDQAQEVVREAGQKVQRVAEEAGHAVQREAKAQQLTV
jgi:ElaB/YqjD/DUF883 family membrane-anchored ribosome-binding protein